MKTHELQVLRVTDRHAIKTVTKDAPEFDRVAALALIVEPVDPVQGRALVVAAQKEKGFRVLDLVAQQKRNCFDRLFCPVNVVTQKNVVRRWGEATNLCAN